MPKDNMFLTASATLNEIGLRTALYTRIQDNNLNEGELIDGPSVTKYKVNVINIKSATKMELIIKAAFDNPLSLFGFLKSMMESTKAASMKIISQIPITALIFKNFSILPNSPPVRIFKAIGVRARKQNTNERIPIVEYLRFFGVPELFSFISILSPPVF
jgi:hypothetical protein